MRTKTTRLCVALAMGAAAALTAAAVHPSWLEAARNRETCDGHTHDDMAPASSTKKGRFDTLADVSLSSNVEQKLNAVAEAFRKKTGKTFVVTSGTRDPDNQAELIYAKLAAGEDLLKLYRDKSAVLELVRVFDSSRDAKKSRATTISLIAATIRAQIKRGIYISAHLRAGAADVRSSTMSPTERRTFAEIAKDAGLGVILETTPPHFHLQLE